MSTLATVDHKTYTGLNVLQLVRRLLPLSLHNGTQVLDSLGDHVRFRAHIGYEHPKHQVAYIDASTKPIQIYLNQSILAGVLGTLPAPYLELCYQRSREGDNAMAAFLDIFNHRINTLRFWTMMRTSPDLGLAEDQLPLPGRLINAINGDQTGPLNQRQLLAIAGLLNHPCRSHSFVQSLLQRLIGLPLQLQSFLGGWLPLDKEQHIALGQHNSHLAKTSIIGTRCWDQHKSLRLIIQVSTYEQLVAFQPEGARHQWLCKLVRWITHYRYDIEVCLSLPKTQQALPLHSQPPAGKGLRLAYTSWLYQRAPENAECKQWRLNTKVPAQAIIEQWQLTFTIPALR
jgi:type VI secretion system protein ImpH